MKGVRITVIFDEETLKKLRVVQAKLITETKRSWSFSKTLSIVSSMGIGSKNFDEIVNTVIETAKKRDSENV